MRCATCGQDNAPEASFCANCGAQLVAGVEVPSPQAAPGPVAPPAVAADLAGFWRRFAAALIDAIILWLVNGILAGIAQYGLVSVMGEGLWTVREGRAGDLVRVMVLLVIFIVIFILVVPWLYYWLFIGLKGQTLGKMAVGVKVVDGRGNTPGLGRAALREVVGKVVSSIPLFLGFLWMVWDRKKQGWHDKLAGTYVVKTRR